MVAKKNIKVIVLNNLQDVKSLSVPKFLSLSKRSDNANKRRELLTVK